MGPARPRRRCDHAHSSEEQEDVEECRSAVRRREGAGAGGPCRAPEHERGPRSACRDARIRAMTPRELAVLALKLGEEMREISSRAEAIEHAMRNALGSLSVVDLAHLVALKLYAGGPKGKLDVIELLSRNPEADVG